MTERALVTGATGFVGSAVVRRLLARGMAVRALVRPQADTRNLDGLELDIVHGDVLDPASLGVSVEGARWVFHVAAEYRLWHPRPEELMRANVEGTRNLLTAARAAGVERVVHTSSVATLAPRADHRPADEACRRAPEEAAGPYELSKILSEREAQAAARNGLDVVVVHPTAPVGPRDRRPTPTGRMLLDAAAGRTPAWVDTGLNLVHVDDVGEGHVLAAERGRCGESYILGERDMSLLEILTCAAAQTGRRPPRLRLAPGWLVPLAHAAQGWARITGGGEPRLTVTGLRLAREHMYYSADKARRELGFAPRPAEEGVQAAVAWFRAQGYLG